MKKFVAIITGFTALFSCSSQQQKGQTDNPTVKPMVLTHAAKIGGPVSALAPTIVYRMSGDYANLVPVRLDETETALTWYPDPMDITEAKRPEKLIDGWYLDHTGVGENTAFTSYTYSEYHALKKVPTQQELLSHIIVRNAVTEVRNLGTQPLSRDSIISLLTD